MENWLGETLKREKREAAGQGVGGVAVAGCEGDGALESDVDRVLRDPVLFDPAPGRKGGLTGKREYRDMAIFPFCRMGGGAAMDLNLERHFRSARGK